MIMPKIVAQQISNHIAIDRLLLLFEVILLSCRVNSVSCAVKKNQIVIAVAVYDKQSASFLTERNIEAKKSPARCQGLYKFCLVFRSGSSSVDTKQGD